MALEETKKRLTIETVSSPLDKVASDINKVADAEARLAVTSQQSERAALSQENAFAKLERRYVDSVRQQAALAKVQRDVNAAVAQNPALQERANTVMANATRRITEVNRGQQSLVDSTKLSRYELINLSRQVQDVGVGLASGQGFLTVAIQQGTQFADVIAASQVTVRQMFSQAIGWAGRFAMSTAGVATGVIAIGASALLAASSWSSGQREIDRALTGIGRASGATRDQINSIAEASARTTAASAGEAREAASIFAGTGKIYAENIQVATDLTKDFARATGTDMTAAANAMAAALADPVKGALELNKTLGFLDGKTLQYIQTLQNQNRAQEAQRALMDAARSSIQEQARAVGLATQAWDTWTKAVSNTWARISEGAARAPQAIARVAGAVRGPDLGGFSDEENLAAAREKLAARQRSVFQGSLAQPGIKAAADEVARLEEKLRAAAVAAADARFRDFSLQADEAVKSLIPQIQQLEKLEAKLNDIKRAREGVPAIGGIAGGYGGEAAAPAVDPSQISGRMGASDQDLQRAAEAAQLLKRIISETADQTARANSEALRLAAAYGDISIEVAKTLEQQRANLSVAEAVTGAQKIAAQEAATYNQLISEGRTHQEAAAVAAGQTANALAQVNSQAQLALAALRDQEAVAGAVTAQEKMAAQEQATINDLIRQGVDAATAMNTAFQQTANAQAQINANAQQTLAALKDQHAVATATSAQDKISAQRRADYNGLVRQGVDGPLAEQIASQKAATAEEQRQNQQYQERIRLLQQLQQSLGLSLDNLSNMRLFMADTEAAAFDAASAAKQFQRAMEGAALAAEQAAQNTREAAASAAAAADDAAKRTLVGTRGTFELGPGPGQFSQKEAAEARGADAEFRLLGGTMTRALFDVVVTETSESVRKMINEILGRGGSLDEAINELMNPPWYKQGAIPDQLRFDTMIDLLRRQTEMAGDPTKEIELLKQQIMKVQQQPRSLEQMDLLKTLNDRLKELQESTEKLTDAIKIGLDPIYTQGHDALKIGYYDERGGGMRTGTGWTSPFMAQQQSLPGGLTAVGGTGVGTSPGPMNTPWQEGPQITPPGIKPRSGTFSFGPMTDPAVAAAFRQQFMPRAQYGLTGIVAGSGGTDSTLVSMMATPGERVAVMPPNAPTPGRTAPASNDNARPPQQVIVINNFPPGSLFGDRRTRRQNAEGYGRSMASVRS